MKFRYWITWLTLPLISGCLETDSTSATKAEVDKQTNAIKQCEQSAKNIQKDQEEIQKYMDRSK